MEIEISGLKCDNCSFRDDDVKFSEYKECIGRSCPDCGESLLTEKEHLSYLREYAIVDKINKVNNVLRWINPFFLWRKLWGYKQEKSSITFTYKNRNSNGIK